MKSKLLPLLGLLTAGLLSSCDRNGEEAGAPENPSPPSKPAPAAPTSEAIEALKAQSVGRKLIGNTHLLVGDRFVKTDLAVAPEYYFLYYSASW